MATWQHYCNTALLAALLHYWQHGNMAALLQYCSTVLFSFLLTMNGQGQSWSRSRPLQQASTNWDVLAAVKLPMNTKLPYRKLVHIGTYWQPLNYQ